MDKLTEIKNKINQLGQYKHSRCGRPDIKVACILDTFSYECFKYECSMEQLRADTWKQQMMKIKPDFLLVESAWLGVDGKWKPELVRMRNNPRSRIRQIISYCKQNKIKTVFWNKEDPSSYATFFNAAKLFDYIFTTDVGCVGRYKKDIGHDRIYVLPFAAQPVLHNPVHASYADKGNVAFSGTWRSIEKSERPADMHMLLKPAKEYGLTIFNRKYGSKVKKLQYPQQYKPHVVGSLHFNDMSMAYKLYKVFLNVNSVKYSSTMFSRRVFELLASGTNVLSTYSKGIAEMFKGIVPITLSEEQTKRHLSQMMNDPEYSRRLSQLGIREVYSKHLYKHRFNYILEQIGVKYEPIKKEGISVIACTKKPELMDHIVTNYINQSWENKELIVIINHDSLNLDHWREKAKHVQNVSIYQLPGDKSIGECRNWAIDKTKYNYITLFSTDHYYAPHFIIDLMHAFDYSNAHIVGKCSYYTYIESMNALAIRFPNQENQYVDYLCGSAMIVKKDVFHHVQFPAESKGMDTSFFKNCVDKGFKMYAADKYNYVHKSMAKQLPQNCQIVSSTDDYKTFVTV